MTINFALSLPSNLVTGYVTVILKRMLKCNAFLSLAYLKYVYRKAGFVLHGDHKSITFKYRARYVGVANVVC